MSDGEHNRRPQQKNNFQKSARRALTKPKQCVYLGHSNNTRRTLKGKTMRKPTAQQREAMKSTTGKLTHVRLNTFRYGSWVIVKCPMPNGTFNFNATLGNAMSMNVDGTEEEFVARLEACGTT